MDEKRLGDPICDHWVTDIYSNKFVVSHYFDLKNNRY